MWYSIDVISEIRVACTQQACRSPVAVRSSSEALLCHAPCVASAQPPIRILLGREYCSLPTDHPNVSSSPSTAVEVADITRERSLRTQISSQHAEEGRMERRSCRSSLSIWLNKSSRPIKLLYAVGRAVLRLETTFGRVLKKEKREQASSAGAR